MKGIVVSTLALLLLMFSPEVAGARSRGRGAVAACQRAVAKQVRRRHPNAGRVQFLNQRVRKFSKAERGVNGSGRFQLKKGKVYRFSYRCTYNARSGRTYGVRVWRS